MSMTHLKTIGVDARDQGQTDFEYSHQTVCGYVRDNVTTDRKEVTCWFCCKAKEITLKAE